MNYQRKWAGVFASALRQHGGVPWREAISLGWIAAKALTDKKCSLCGINPERGGDRIGGALCWRCFETD